MYFLCTGNSRSSQIAEGFGKKYLGDRYEVRNAGIEALFLNLNAVKTMAEVLKRSAFVITLCGYGSEKYPITPPNITRFHWGFDDPAKAMGTEEEKWTVFQRIRDKIE
ncbi:arsenate reductase [Tumebacillus lipolyticus]|uniref:Arsenate reductase n=1 Tax=Tumebacillus lipolyticus TaxID=1280370 RepID=A0ABW4ZVY2_9BACL